MSDPRPLTHLAAAIIAMAALIASMTVWPALVRERGTADWQVAATIAAAAGSLYLLCTALVTGWSAIYGNCLRFRNSAPDVLLALVVGWMLYRGIEARSLLAGLGAMLPSLATVATIMIVVRLMPALSGATDAQPPQLAQRGRWIEIARIAAAAIAAIALVSLELSELPRAKPWNEHSPAKVAPANADQESTTRS